MNERANAKNGMFVVKTKNNVKGESENGGFVIVLNERAPRIPHTEPGKTRSLEIYISA